MKIDALWKGIQNHLIFIINIIFLLLFIFIPFLFWAEAGGDDGGLWGSVGGHGRRMWGRRCTTSVRGVLRAALWRRFCCYWLWFRLRVRGRCWCCSKSLLLLALVAWFGSVIILVLVLRDLARRSWHRWVVMHVRSTPMSRLRVGVQVLTRAFFVCLFSSSCLLVCVCVSGCRLCSGPSSI